MPDVFVAFEQVELAVPRVVCRRIDITCSPRSRPTRPVPGDGDGIARVDGLVPGVPGVLIVLEDKTLLKSALHVIPSSEIMNVPTVVLGAAIRSVYEKRKIGVRFAPDRSLIDFATTSMGCRPAGAGLYAAF